MTVTPPVILDEFRSYLNLEASDVAEDSERLDKLYAATELVESRCGAMTPREVTVRAAAAFGVLVLKPPVLEVISLSRGGQRVAVEGFTANPASGVIELLGEPRGFVYEVKYVTGRDPVPQALREAVLAVAEQLWQSQRGPSVSARYRGPAAPDTTAAPRGFTWPRRALELIEPFEQLAFA